MKRHNWYRMLALSIIVLDILGLTKHSGVESTTVVVGLWIMAEISELREKA